MFCYTAWTGRDSDVRLGQCVDYGDVPCHCFAGKPGYQRAAVGAFTVISDQTRWFLDGWDVGLTRPAILDH